MLPLIDIPDNIRWRNEIYIEGVCFPLSPISPLVLEASSQWDEGTRVSLGTFLGTYPATRHEQTGSDAKVPVFFFRKRGQIEPDAEGWRELSNRVGTKKRSR